MSYAFLYFYVLFMYVYMYMCAYVMLRRRSECLLLNVERLVFVITDKPFVVRRIIIQGVF
jgi:hypothetical protein